jgi:hypothetical protein
MKLLLQLQGIGEAHHFQAAVFKTRASPNRNCCTAVSGLAASVLKAALQATVSKDSNRCK